MSLMAANHMDGIDIGPGARRGVYRRPNSWA
jgi:hypothetical protein